MSSESLPGGAPGASIGIWTRQARQGVAAVIQQLDWLIQPALAFGISRALVFIVGIVGDIFLPSEEGHWVADPDSSFLSLWAKWDSQWYVQIARDGYAYQPLQQSNVAFFPLYPLLMRTLAMLLGDRYVLAGFLVANLAFFLALIFLYKLACLELGDANSSTPHSGRLAAQRTLYYVALFPTAFFFSAVYTESLFLLLSVACIYFARRRNWLLAAAAGILVATTRNLGVLLWGLVMWEWLRCQGWQITRIHRLQSWRSLWQGIKANWLEVFVLATIPLGLLIYMFFLQQNFARPIAFIEVQAAWQRQNIGPLAVVMRELAALSDLTLSKSNLSRTVNLVAFLGVLAMVPAIWRRLGEGYALYVLLMLLIPSSSGLQSMIRYVLLLFPAFIILGWWGQHRQVDRTLLITFSVLLGLLTTIFVNWFFVA